jgi:signal transduction histidine kinase
MKRRRLTLLQNVALPSFLCILVIAVAVCVPGAVVLGRHLVAAGDAVHVIFEDTGRGMAAEELRRLFDPFYSTKDPERHLGLGLFVSHGIVRQHGGTIFAESKPGSGSTVTVTLPVEPLPIPTERWS